MDEKVMPSAMRKLNITDKKCKNSAGKVFNKTLNVSTRVFTTQPDTQSHKGLLKDFSHTDHFALMTFEERRGKPRPIALQQARLKWLVGFLLLHLQDALFQLVPSLQKAYLRGRTMFDHFAFVQQTWHAGPGDDVAA